MHVGHVGCDFCTTVKCLSQTLTLYPGFMVCILCHMPELALVIVFLLSIRNLQNPNFDPYDMQYEAIQQV